VIFARNSSKADLVKVVWFVQLSVMSHSLKVQKANVEMNNK